MIISTWEDGIFNLEKAIKLKHPEISYLIVHQTQKTTKDPDFIAQRSDIEVVKTATKGISVSRNIGLKHCKTKYAILADDDVEYIEEGIEHLLHAIETKSPDFALYKIQTLPGESEYKNYPEEEYQIPELKHWVSSIEIVVNVHKIGKLNIKFDERFGLGTLLDRGEEEIFIHDLLTKGLTGTFSPIYLVIHPYMSSGKQTRTIEEQWFVKGALDQRMNNVIKPEAIQEKFNYNKEKSIKAELYYNKGIAVVK